jgi:hypothetical protein
MTDIEGLRNALPHLAARDASFATDLLKAHMRYGRLTERQAPWVDRLIQRAKAATEPPKPREQIAVDLSALLRLFDGAAKHLKFPKVILDLSGKLGITDLIKISRAGERAGSPGAINIQTDHAYGDPAGRWFGRIERDGSWYTGFRGATMPDGLMDFVKQFAAEPAKTASEYGHLSGHCMFCRKGLTDPRSKTVGYGRDCASNYGLPWGEKKSDAQIYNSGSDARVDGSDDTTRREREQARRDESAKFTARQRMESTSEDRWSER